MPEMLARNHLGGHLGGHISVISGTPGHPRPGGGGSKLTRIPTYISGKHFGQHFGHKFGQHFGQRFGQHFGQRFGHNFGQSFWVGLLFQQVSLML